MITTGGGFSTLYPTPSWQQDAVATYLAGVRGTDEDPSFGYNANGRAYPDVAMLAVNFISVENLQWVTLYGTSASSPVRQLA